MPWKVNNDNDNQGTPIEHPNDLPQGPDRSCEELSNQIGPKCRGEIWTISQECDLKRHKGNTYFDKGLILLVVTTLNSSNLTLNFFYGINFNDKSYLTRYIDSM